MPFNIPPAAFARPYTLTEYDRERRVVRVRTFQTLASMAELAWVAADRITNNRSWWPYSGYMSAIVQVAESSYGKQYFVEDLFPLGRKNWYDRLKAVGPNQQPEHRRGPWPGIRKYRGGRGAGQQRVQNEQRLNQVVAAEDGEVAARLARGRRHLPTSHDCRYTDRGGRGWKNQHKGIKSWDRPVLP